MRIYEAISKAVEDHRLISEGTQWICNCDAGYFPSAAEFKQHQDTRLALICLEAVKGYWGKK